MDSFWNWLLAVVQHPFGIWDAVGFVGAAVFGARFIIQWLKSEMEGRSVIPIAFWYCSLGGAMINLVYVIHLKSLPLVLGNALPLFIYARNLYLTYRERAALARGGAS
ncbi:MAG TPA: lipid-A-disaccharide synthase N-terminal domain-containing protein [Rhizomicrobium sp.]|nr:lipid-A-disaccharide synthase N-terminal domain-containing protein [Rhizomicrobium sp.]